MPRFIGTDEDGAQAMRDYCELDRIYQAKHDMSMKSDEAATAKESEWLDSKSQDRIFQSVWQMKRRDIKALDISNSAYNLGGCQK